MELAISLSVQELDDFLDFGRPDRSGPPEDRRGLRRATDGVNRTGEST